MPFEHAVTARFFEIDRAGIVFFGRFFEYCHAAFEEMLLAAFGDWDGQFDDFGWAMPLVHVEADFQRPARMGDRLTVTLEVERLTKRSVTFRFVVRASDGSSCAEVRHKHAFIDRGRFESTEVPTRFVEGLEGLGLLPESEA